MRYPLLSCSLSQTIKPYNRRRRKETILKSGDESEGVECLLRDRSISNDDKVGRKKEISKEKVVLILEGFERLTKNSSV